MSEEIKTFDPVTFIDDESKNILDGTVIGLRDWGYYVTVHESDDSAKSYAVKKDKIIPARDATWALSLNDQTYQKLSQYSGQVINADTFQNHLNGFCVNRINNEFLKKSQTPSYKKILQLLDKPTLKLDAAYAMACRYPFLVRTDTNGIGQPFYRDITIATRNDGGTFHMYNSIATPASVDEVPSVPVPFPVLVDRAFGVQVTAQIVVPFCEDLRQALIKSDHEYYLDNISMSFKHDSRDMGHVIAYLTHPDSYVLDIFHRITTAHATINNGDTMHLPDIMPTFVMRGFTFPVPHRT